jgi:hypothetical protein
MRNFYYLKKGYCSFFYFFYIIITFRKIKEDELRRNIIIRSVVEAIYALTHFLYPFIPQVLLIIFKEKIK